MFPEPMKSEQWTVGTWVERHFADLETAGSRSVGAYRTRWLRFGGPLFRVALETLSTRAVYDWTTGLRAERTIFGTPPSPAYARAAFAVLNGAMIAAVAAGLVASNPCQGLRRYLPKRARGVRAKRRNVQRGEARALLTSRAVPLHARRMYAVAIYAGLRPGEVCGIQFRDLHMDAPVPFVHIARSWDEFTKTFSSERDVPLHPELIDFFLAPLVKHEWQALVKRPWTPRDHVFSSRKGTPYRTRRLAHALDQHFCKLGILDGCTFHGLRHTGSTLWSDDGLDEGTIGAILGHAPTQTRHYARPSLERLGREIRQFSLLRAQTVDTCSVVDNPCITSIEPEAPPMTASARTRSSCSSAPLTPEQISPPGVTAHARAKSLPRPGSAVVAEWKNPIQLDPPLDGVRDELLPPGARALGATVAAGLALADVTDRLDAAASESPADPVKIAALVVEHGHKLSTYRSARGSRVIG